MSAEASPGFCAGVQPALASGEATLDDLLARCRARIEAREPAVRAWKALNWDNAAAQARALADVAPAARGPLWGALFGVKDVFDTADLPTGYGSDIYEGFQPRADAACVARLRAAGAIVVGKTVSTEFAFWKQGATRHPRDPARSPGGSSSGSAAAVADGMVPFALGTQTAASIIRPAAYCGVVGLKPSRGVVSLAGVKGFAASLDTAGVLARSVADAALALSVLSGRRDWSQPPPQTGPLRLRIWTGPETAIASDAARAALEGALEIGRADGARIDAPPPPKGFEALAEIQTTIMAYEAARELAHERLAAFDQLSDPLRGLLQQGEAVSADAYDAALAARDGCMARLDELFGEADALIAPSAPDVAPLYEQGTGDPAMSRVFTLLGLPSVTLPIGGGDRSLPHGAQLACRPGRDAQLLAIAGRFERLFAGAGAST